LLTVKNSPRLSDSKGRELLLSVWEIGILEGNSPYDWTPGNEFANPVLTATNVTDIEAEFVADPFMVQRGGVWHLFFEAFRKDARLGEIGLAVSSDIASWEYRRIVLRESFHLSYPYVFEWEGDYYMIPESLGADEIRLYKCANFPLDWQLHCSLIPGRHADPSIFRHGNRWWMFTCDTPFAHRSLRLYSAARLEGPWEEHPESPIVEQDASVARPAGRVISFHGRLIRFAQDCSKQYGREVWPFEITHLDRKKYRERRASTKPAIGARSTGHWRTSRMHHIDAHTHTAGRWIACVDGWPVDGGGTR
jgi:hypothetical protein